MAFVAAARRTAHNTVAQREDSMKDRRREQRWPVYLGGSIAFSSRFKAVDCVVRNISPRGARLAIESSGTVPDAFDLLIPQKQSEYRARARWRKSDAIGVEFTRADETKAPIPLSLARRIRRLEKENAALRQRLRGGD
jgi:hypothetical protein